MASWPLIHMVESTVLQLHYRPTDGALSMHYSLCAMVSLCTAQIQHHPVWPRIEITFHRSKIAFYSTFSFLPCLSLTQEISRPTKTCPSRLARVAWTSDNAYFLAQIFFLYAYGVLWPTRVHVSCTANSRGLRKAIPPTFVDLHNRRSCINAHHQSLTKTVAHVSCTSFLSVCHGCYSSHDKSPHLSTTCANLQRTFRSGAPARGSRVGRPKCPAHPGKKLIMVALEILAVVWKLSRNSLSMKV